MVSTSGPQLVQLRLLLAVYMMMAVISICVWTIRFYFQIWANIDRKCGGIGAWCAGLVHVSAIDYVWIGFETRYEVRSGATRRGVWWSASLLWTRWYIMCRARYFYLCPFYKHIWIRVTCKGVEFEHRATDGQIFLCIFILTKFFFAPSRSALFFISLAALWCFRRIENGRNGRFGMDARTTVLLTEYWMLLLFMYSYIYVMLVVCTIFSLLFFLRRRFWWWWRWWRTPVNSSTYLAVSVGTSGIADSHIRISR